MKKRIVFGMIGVLAVLTASACASPYEMQDGKWNVNMGVTIDADADVDWNGRVPSLDGDTSFFGGVTYGLTDKWGIQVDYSHYKAEYQYENGNRDMPKLDATEVNLLYRLNPYANVFIGYVYAGLDWQDRWAGTNGQWFSSHTDGVQVGLSGWYPLSDKFKTFGKVGVGNNSRIYEIGFSYAIADNWDIDLSYRDAEYKDFSYHNDLYGGFADHLDLSYDGVRLGVSTSF